MEILQSDRCTRVLWCIALLFVFGGVSQAGISPKFASQTALGVPCSEILERGIDKQENLRATMIRVACGLDAPGQAELEGEGTEALDFTNINLITGAEVFPHVTQSESMVWSTPDGQTVVVNYNASRGVASSPINIAG